MGKQTFFKVDLSSADNDEIKPEVTAKGVVHYILTIQPFLSSNCNMLAKQVINIEFW